jgi:hypothetical protein
VAIEMVCAVVHVVQDLCVRCTTSVPHEGDKSGQSWSTVVEQKGE